MALLAAALLLAGATATGGAAMEARWGGWGHEGVQVEGSCYGGRSWAHQRVTGSQCALFVNVCSVGQVLRKRRGGSPLQEMMTQLCSRHQTARVCVCGWLHASE